MHSFFFEFLFFFTNSLLVLIVALINVAMLTLLERKILASLQLRTGPNTVGIYGILQPIADAIKLMTKEFILPNRSNKLLFILSPIFGLVLSILPWFFFPFDPFVGFIDHPLGLLILFAINGLISYPILISGWASNSRFPLLGALRATSTLISYELVLGLSLLPSLSIAGALSLNQIIICQGWIWSIVPLFCLFLCFLIASLAEAGRPPFDLVEGESELVGGFATEYSGMFFSLFALIEYGHVLTSSFCIQLIFLGGWIFYPIEGFSTLNLLPFATIFKFIILILFFIFTRGIVPRFRLDALMTLCWKNLLLLTFASIFFCWGFFFLHLI